MPARFRHAEKGWADSSLGKRPTSPWCRSNAKDLPPQPSQNHRQAVRLRLLLSAKAAGGTERLRELADGERRDRRLRGAVRPMGRKSRAQPRQGGMAKLTGVKPETSGGGGQSRQLSSRNSRS